MGFEILSIGSVAKEIPSKGPIELLQIGQHTRLQGKSGLYVVVGVDEERQTADLISSAGISPVLNRIPLDRIRPLADVRLEDSNERVLPFPS